jgi:radical SAM superfamily enzyme YgiQ (UPF0313 family)
VPIAKRNITEMNRHKVVLYNPKSVFFAMPLALLAIGSYLDPKKYEVIIIDGRLEKNPLNKIMKELDGALCLGITVLTGNPINDALYISDSVKRVHPDIPIIWGGWHPSLFPKQTLIDENSIDISVQGQGEVTFSELVDHLADRADLQHVKGICYRADGKIIQNSARDLQDMNDFPFINYNLIPVESYFKLKKKRQLDYISSIGCYYRCAFCADPFVFKRKWSGYHPERIGDELIHLKQSFEMTDIDFQDETFFTYQKRAIDTANHLIKSDLNSSWAATMRADQGFRLKDEHFDLLVKSGLRRVLIGVESGSEEMLKRLQKDITPDQVLVSAERCLKHNIAVIFPFIIGFPDESDESVQKTMAFCKKLREMHPDFVTPVFYFKPYPGSPITQNEVRKGYRLPQTTREWAKFDYVGSSGPWVTPEKYELIEKFKFYNRIAWNRRKWWSSPLQKLARWRCKNDYYKLPFDKIIVESLKPQPELS